MDLNAKTRWLLEEEEESKQFYAKIKLMAQTIRKITA